MIVAVGAQLALQAPVNNRLGDSVGRLAAALVSNTVGTAILVVCFLVVLALGVVGGSEGPAGLFHVPAWQLLGGLSGGLWVAMSAIAVGRIGAGTVAAATITGQLVSALVIDQFGWLGIEQRPATALRLAGVVLLVIGTVLVARRPARRGDGGHPSGRAGAANAAGPVGGAIRAGASRTGAAAPAEAVERHPGLVAAIFAVGLAMGFQHPLNALLSDTVGDVTSSLVNFAVGTLLLVAAVGFTGRFARFRGMRRPRPLYLLGGLFGVIVVVASIVVVKIVGATVLFAALITGQLFGSVVLDRMGAFGLDPRPLDPKRLAGLLLLLAGTVAAVA